MPVDVKMYMEVYINPLLSMMKEKNWRGLWTWIGLKAEWVKPVGMIEVSKILSSQDPSWDVLSECSDKGTKYGDSSDVRNWRETDHPRYAILAGTDSDNTNQILVDLNYFKSKIKDGDNHNHPLKKSAPSEEELLFYRAPRLIVQAREKFNRKNNKDWKIELTPDQLEVVEKYERIKMASEDTNG